MDERPPRSRYAQPAPRPEPVPVAPAKTFEPPKSDKKQGRVKKTAAKARSNWWKILIALVILILVGFFIQNYLHTRSQLKKLSDTKTAAQASDQELINQVGEFVVLPQGETPTVATVNDVSKLKDQVFFQYAQNGDKVLIFSQAKTAVLYRPSVKKIVEYAPINVDTSSAGTSTNTQAPKKQ